MSDYDPKPSVQRKSLLVLKVLETVIPGQESGYLLLAQSQHSLYVFYIRVERRK